MTPHSPIHADHSRITVDEHSDPGDPLSSIAVFSAPSTSHAATALRQRIMSFFGTPRLSKDELADLEVAVGEACTNAVRHGSPRGTLDQVLVRCVKETCRLVVEVSDRGYGFDPNAVPCPAPEQLRESGMGVFLMKCCVDKVEFEFGSGTTVRLVKYCHSN